MSTMKVHIKSSGDKKYEVTVDASSTIEDLKVIISAEADVPPERQRLIYSGKVLKDTETVASYKIQDGHTIHLVKSAAPKAEAAAGSTSPTGSTTGASSPANSGSVPSNLAAGQGSFNPLADLTGARYAGYTQLPSASMFGPDGGMGAFPDPEQMNDMMSSPMFQEQMNALLLNPEMLDFMINQNPQLRAMGPQVRTMLQSPMFRAMLLNPETLRSMMNMSRQQAGASTGGAFPAPGLNPTLGGDSASGAATSTDSASTPGAAAGGAANPFASLFPNGMPPVDPFAMFGGAGAGAGGAAAAQDDRPPEVRYESQLGQLNDMGFFDFDQNVAALRRSGGNVQGAVEFLLSGNF